MEVDKVLIHGEAEKTVSVVQDSKNFKETEEEDEHVLVRDMPKSQILVTKPDTVAVEEPAILKETDKVGSSDVEAEKIGIEKMEEIPKEVTQHQQEEEAESSDLGEKSMSVIDLTRRQDESSEKDKETKLQEKQIQKHEPKNEDIPHDNQIHLDEKSDIKANEEEQTTYKIHKILETVEESHTSLPSSSEKQEHGTVAEPTGDTLSLPLEASRSDDDTESSGFVSDFKEQKPKQIREILEEERNEKRAEILPSTTAHESESLKDSTRTTEEVKESLTVIEPPTIQGEEIESKTLPELKEEVDQSSKDTEEDEHVLDRNMLQDEIFVTEAETKEDTDPSVFLKEDKEQDETEIAKTVISSDEVISSDVQAEEFGQHTKPCRLEIKDESHGREESVEVKSKETTEQEDENLLDVPSEEIENYQDNEPQTVVVAKTKIDNVDGTQTMEEQRGIDSNELEADQITDETEETSTTVDEKIEEKPEEEQVTLHQQEGQEEASYGSETKEETISVPENMELGVKSHEEEEESCLPNEQEKETIFPKEKIEKEEPANEVVHSVQQSHVEEKSDEVIKVSSASPSEEREGGIAVETVYIEPVKSNEDDIDEVLNKTDELNEEKDSKTAETSVNGTEAPVEEISRNIVNETAPEDNHQGQKAEPEETIRNSDDAEKISHQVTGDREKEDDITTKTAEVQQTRKDTEKHEHVLAREMPQVETLVTEAVSVDTKSAILKSLEKKIDETEEVHSAIDGEEGQETKEETEQSLDLKADKEQEEIEKVKTDISSDEVRCSEKAEELSEHTEHWCSDIKTRKIVQEESSEKNKNMLDDKTMVDQVDGTQTMEEQRGLELKVPIIEAEETTHDQAKSVEEIKKPSLESVSKVSEETSKIGDDKVEEKPEEEQVTLHQQEGSYGLQTKEETISVPESSELGRKSQEEESCPPNEQERENKLQKEKIEKHESTSEEDTNAHQTPLEEKSNEAEQVADRIQKSLEHVTIAEAEKIEDEKVKEIEPIGDMREKGLGISETQSSELVAEFEEQRPKQVKEILEGERKEADETKAETIPLETLSDVEAVQIKRENDATNNHVDSSEKNLDEHVDSSEKNLDEHVDSSEKNDNETLIAETKKEDEDMAVGLDGSGTSKTSENVCIEPEEFENLEAPKVVETSQEDETPSVVSEQDHQTSKQVEEIHDDEDTKITDVEVDEITKGQSISPENACLKIIEDQDSLLNESSDAYTFSKETGGTEHGDETLATLPVVEILKELQTTLENEREIKDSALSGDEALASKIIEENKLQQDESGESETNHEENSHAGKSLPIEEHTLKEEVKIQDSTRREFEVKEKLEEEEEEKREIAVCKKEIQVGQSLREMLPDEKILIPSSDLPSEVTEHVTCVEKNEEGNAQQGANASTAAKISLQEEQTIDFETSKEQKVETHETVKEDKIKEEKKKNEEVKDKKLDGLPVTRDVEETFKDKEDESELGVGHDFVSAKVEKEEAPQSVLGKEEDINEVARSEKQITEQVSDAEKESKEEHVESQAKSDDTKSNNDRDFPAEQIPKDQREEVQEQEKKSNDLTDIQENIGTNAKPEAQKQGTGLIEEKRKVDYVKTELEDAIQEKNESEEIYEKESKQTDRVTAIKEEIREEEEEEEEEEVSRGSKEMFLQKETTQECFNTEKTQLEVREIENLSSDSNTEDKSEQKVKGTNKIEDKTKTEEEEEDGDEHKDDKTSPDSMVMVEAKDTVNVIKTHKKGILSGVGSKVKHSISKVKKALTGKSSHTTKPSSPK